MHVLKQNKQNAATPLIYKTTSLGGQQNLAVITIVHAAKHGMKCLQTSYDEALGPYSDLSKSGHRNLKAAVKFAPCDVKDPHRLQRFRLRRLTDSKGVVQSEFILHPL